MTPLDEGATWSAKEVFSDLKTDIMARFDTQDRALGDIRRDLTNTATKADVVTIHQRIDGVVRDFDQRIEPLEAEFDAEAALRRNRASWRSRFTVWGGVAAAVAAVALVVVTLVHP